jgi:cell division protein FtsB
MYRPPSKWYWIALLLLAMGAYFYADQRGFNQRIDEARRSHEQVEELRGELRAAEAAVARLEDRVEYLHGDPVEMEAAVRRNKNLVREGETLFRVVLPEERDSQ